MTGNLPASSLKVQVFLSQHGKEFVVPNSVFKLNPQHLAELTQGQWIDLAK